MKGDFARVTFDPTRHYSQVLQQQGRVLLEADWNEQAAIQLELLRALATDLVGPRWAAGGGFRISAPPKSAGKVVPLAKWLLSGGHFYVDGILCVNDSKCSLGSQPFGPTPDDGAGENNAFEGVQAPYALWLDVWERHVSCVEAPAIEDIALNGVDTASRAQVVWQVRILDRERAKAILQSIHGALLRRRDAEDPASSEARALASTIERFEKSPEDTLTRIFAGIEGTAPADDRARLPCEPFNGLLELRASRACPQLRAQLQSSDADDDPCVIAADARYRGCENQLYRIEIHDGGLAAAAGTSGATFKWSRENGSVVFALTGVDAPGEPDAEGNASMTVTLANLGRDQRLGLEVGDWVELLDDDYTLAQRALPLLQVTGLDTPRCAVYLTVPEGVTPYVPSADPGRHPMLRRWDQRNEVGPQGVLDVQEGQPLDLEDGIQVSFEAGGLYATGDYWLVPARVAGNGTVLWPQEPGAEGKLVAAAVRASGLHHFAVLGGVDTAGNYKECCCRFVPPCVERLHAAGGGPADFAIAGPPEIAGRGPRARGAGAVARPAPAGRKKVPAPGRAPR